MTTPFLTPHLLAERWSVTSRTLKQWRWNGAGPDYLKLGSRILYRLEDVQKFEREKLRKGRMIYKEAV